MLRNHCAHARYVWNLAVEQYQHWHPGRKSAPRYLEQCRQLTQARAEHPWLAAGSQMVQQQALRDFDKAMAAFFNPQNPAGRPSWRRPAGTRVSASWADAGSNGTCAASPATSARYGCRRLGGCGSAGPAPFPPGVKSYRVTMDRAGRWHVAFAAIPDPVPAPGNGEVVGIDRGVAVSAALSTGELLHVPGLTARECRRLRRLERKLARAKRTRTAADG